MILNSGENCVRSVLWHFRCFFSQLLGHSCTSAVCPRLFFCAWCQKLHCRGLRTSVRSAQMCFFHVFPAFFVFFQRRCKGGREMAGKIPTTFAISCNRPSALWVSQPSLLSCSLLSTFLLRFPSLFSFFLQIFLFSPFSFFPSLFLFFFPQFSSNFPSPPPTSRFFRRFLAKATRLHVTPLLAMCPTRHLHTQGRGALCKRIFACFSAFLGHIQKKGSLSFFR